MVALFSRTLHPVWEFSPGLPIWRVHPPVQGRIVGEVRDPEAKKACFFALDEGTGNALWRDRELHDAWWVAIERVAGDKLVLHGYQSPDYPLPLGVTVVDLRNGTVLWSDPRWAGEKAALVAAGVDLSPTPPEQEPVFPVAVDPQAAETPGNRVLAQWPLDRVVGPLETVEVGKNVVVAAHCRSGESPAAPLQHLLKVHRWLDGKIVYEDTLAMTAKGVAPDAYFLHAGLLFYVRERSTLCAVRL